MGRGGLTLLRSPVLQEMSEARQEQMRVRSGMRRYYKELQDVAGKATGLSLS